MSCRPVIFIVGVTASGKTACALEVAKRLNGEIICADSQTLRKDLNIGTAKPAKEEQSSAKHHMLDLIEPYDRFSVAEFKKQAEVAIQEIQSRGKIPIVVGGTGLYIDSLFYDYDLTINKIDRDEYDNLSVNELQQIIVDRGYELPANKNNPRHLIGVIARAGETSIDIIPAKDSLIYGIRRPDTEIKDRINKRVEIMFDNGLIDEVKSVSKKYGKPPAKLDAICYPIIQRYLDGNINLDEAKQLFKTADWQYARRQKAWFKRNQFIQWFEDEKQAADAIIKDVAHY